MQHTGFWAEIAARAAATPDAEMMVDERGRRMTYGQYRSAAEGFAAHLAERGVGEGTVVTWQLPTWLESVVVVGALTRLGAVQNPVMPIYRERELSFVTKQAGSRLLIVPPVWRGFDYPAMAATVAARTPGLEVMVVDGTGGGTGTGTGGGTNTGPGSDSGTGDGTSAEASPDGVALPYGDPASLPPEPPAPERPEDAPVRWYFYTSGTTADPKGARHTDATVLAAGTGMSDRIRCVPGDRVGLVFPFAHIGGCTTWLTASLVYGVTMILTEAFDPVATVELLRREKVTLAGAGTVFHQTYLAAQRRDPGTPLFPDVRCFPGGAAPKPPGLHLDVKRELGGTGIVAGWGLTEAPILTMAGVEDPDEALAAAEGRANTGVRLRVVGPDGTDVPPGGEGELRAKGPQLMLGYLDASLDAEAFDEDGWFRTGDLGRLDADGNVYITGRLKDVIIRKGETISAKEIEDLLSAHPDVADVAVVGLPDPVTGERACAVVVARDPSAPPDLDRLGVFLRGQGLMIQKLPERLEIVGQLPRNPAGKVLKKELKERFS
ncbi:AMP-binding protein [Yinghuangia seranimata]|uniref:AMP-binding protein n=1 Tax=Yinghuangia seranimata TaxID=408067 RepID=UPI00248BA4EB|nr:AMP-binding protein [Yinghuangia seranimata]MDI2126039.1 AMP-binding protein [Yinghuangia seranimata]